MKTILRHRIIFILIAGLILANSSSAQFYQWQSIGSAQINGTNGTVNSITKLNSNIVVGGGFSSAGSLSVSNIAMFDGSTWSSFGSGMNDTIYTLAVLAGNLYAGGKFTQAGGNSIQGIARWNGTAWQSLGTGINGVVRAMTLYNGKLIVGGKFSNVGNNVASWDGLVWTAFGQGVNDTVYALSVVSNVLHAGGSFTTAGGLSANKIASWNGTVWAALGTGMNNTVLAITDYNGYVAAGGRFTVAGSVNAMYIATWSGAAWTAFAFNLDNPVNTLAYYNNSLIVGGSFQNVAMGSGSLFVNHICKWDAAGCTRLITGTNKNVKVLYLTDTSLYVGGDFSTAGGDFISHAAVYRNVPVHTINGTVRYSDNSFPVTTGIVRSLRLDFYSREIIVVDSAVIQPSGAYSIPHGIGDSTFIVAFPNDEIQDRFIPTYYPSSLDWVTATKVFASANLSNVDINVIRSSANGSSLSNISGHVYLNFNPAQQQPGFPFSKDAIVYAKQGSTYRHFAVTDSTEKYILTGLAPGTYDLVVNRIGYHSASRTVTLGTSNIDTIDFYLDTAAVIGIQNISTAVPDGFRLYQNYPNPFNPSTAINFDVKSKSFVTITIYNITGQQIAVLVSEELNAGEYRFLFNASNMPSGVYFYMLRTPEFSETKKMILIK